MTRIKYKQSTKNSTPKHLLKPTYKKATRKQLKLLRDLEIDFEEGISSFSAHCLISKALNKVE